jgi:hypothetical protein
MSNSKKSPRVRNSQTLQEALFEEGVNLIAGRLENTFQLNSRDLTIEEIEFIQSLPEDGYEQFLQLLEGKSQGAKFLAWQCYNATTRNKQFNLSQAKKDWAAVKELRYWARSRTEDLITCKLGHDEYPDAQFRLASGALLDIGIRYEWQAERFLNLYKEVMNPKRSWDSCYQVHKPVVLAIATTPNFNRLPLWVKKVMVNANAFEVNDRIGNIWRLPDCARAWKWCGDLPKGIAERIGRMSVKSRFLAKLAWEGINQGVSTGWKGYHSLGWKSPYHAETYNRHELTMAFWAKFRELSRMSFVELLPLFMVYGNGDRYAKKYYQTLLEVVLNLPHESLPWTDLNQSKNSDQLLLGLVDFLSPAKACEHLFGTAGKATVRAFQNSSPTPRKWAMVLVNGNADLLQKYLNLPEDSVIGFQEDAIAFLKSLSPEVALRMIQTTTFKVRGEVNPVDNNLVRDTGYLYKQLGETDGGFPELGRVRCWLTVHETLAKEYVRRQPDYELKVNPDFKRVQGLCAVDGSWELEIPTCNAQLKLWGEQLSHCVGGYGQAVNSGRSIILAVREQGRVTHTVEMIKAGNSYSCQQFYGYRNSSAPDNLRSSVLNALSQANLCN